MTDDTLLPFDLPAVCRKKVSAAFDGGLISSDGGLVLLREAERRLGLADTLAGCIRDRRNQAQVVHTLCAMSVSDARAPAALSGGGRGRCVGRSAPALLRRADHAA